MDEIIDELHEIAESVPVPLELPEHDQVVDAQEQILMPLPRDFRDFLMTCGDVVYGSLEPVTVADPGSHTYLPEVTATAWSLGMPRDLVAVCEARDGYYCIAQDGEIHFWQSEGLDEGNTWETIWYWVRDLWMES